MILKLGDWKFRVDVEATFERTEDILMNIVSADIVRIITMQLTWRIRNFVLHWKTLESIWKVHVN